MNSVILIGRLIRDPELRYTQTSSSSYARFTIAVDKGMSKEKKQELEAKEFEVSVGGGAVTVKVNGKKEVLDVTMKPEVVDPDDIEMLQDLVISAVNEALRKVDDAQSSQMSKMTGGMNIPGLF